MESSPSGASALSSSIGTLKSSYTEMLETKQ
jgi:hypothetical protein